MRINILSYHQQLNCGTPYHMMLFIRKQLTTFRINYSPIILICNLIMHFWYVQLYSIWRPVHYKHIIKHIRPFWFIIIQNNFLFPPNKKFLTHSRRFPVMPQLRSLEIKLLCGTESKALAKSKYKISTEWPASSAFVQSFIANSWTRSSCSKSMLLWRYNIVGLEIFLNVVLIYGFHNFADGWGETNRIVVVNSSVISLLK